MSVRTEVMAELVAAADDAIAAGKWAPDELQKRFPGLPESIAYEAWTQADVARSKADEEKWWAQVERTIDGEIIRRALEKQG